MALALARRTGFTGFRKHRSLLAAMWVNAFGAGMFFPFAMLYYQAATSLSVATIGVALASATLVTLVATPVTGSLVDRFGARQFVVIGQCLEVAGFAGYLFVSSSLTLFAAALFATSGARVFYASISALVAALSDGSERDRLYGFVGVTQSIGATASGFAASIVIGSTGIGGFRAAILGNIACQIGNGPRGRPDLQSGIAPCWATGPSSCSWRATVSSCCVRCCSVSGWQSMPPRPCMRPCGVWARRA